MAFRPIVITASADAEPSFERHGEPVCIGVMCPCGAIQRGEHWVLTDQRGRNVPVQTTTLDRWGDGSVRWLLVDFQADTVADGQTCYALAPGQPDEADGPSIVIEHAGEVLRVSTGVAIVDVPRSGSEFLSRVQVAGTNLLRATAIVAEDADGIKHRLVVQRTRIERAGRLRADIRLDGHLPGPTRESWLDVSIALSFFAGLGTIKAELSVTNPGARGSILIRYLSIEIDPVASEGADVWGSLDHGDRMRPAGTRFAVHQESSRGPHRATPIASIGGGDRRVSIALPRFWEVFPKAIEAEPGRCAIAMFPRANGDLHELQSGERSTLSFAVCFGRDTVTAEPLAWIRSPLGVTANPNVYRHEGHDAPARGAIRGPEFFFERREAVDEYGWRNFGDLHADDEGALVPDHDHQHDAIAGCLERFLQTADHRWWVLADDLAAHVTDIGLSDATTEHNYTAGLMLHHFLSGSERSRRAVIQIANRVVDMDDDRSINALLDAHRLTNEPRYLEKAEVLIGRGVHADDPKSIERLKTRLVLAGAGLSAAAVALIVFFT